VSLITASGNAEPKLGAVEHLWLGHCGVSGTYHSIISDTQRVDWFPKVKPTSIKSKLTPESLLDDSNENVAEGMTEQLNAYS